MNFTISSHSINNKPWHISHIPPFFPTSFHPSHHITITMIFNTLKNKPKWHTSEFSEKSETINNKPHSRDLRRRRRTRLRPNHRTRSVGRDRVAATSTGHRRSASDSSWCWFFAGLGLLVCKFRFSFLCALAYDVVRV